MILIRSSSVLVILLAVLGPTAATQELDAAKFKELTSSGKNGMVKVSRNLKIMHRFSCAWLCVVQPLTNYFCSSFNLGVVIVRR